MPGVGWEEAFIVAKIEPLSVPLGMICHQPSWDVLVGLPTLTHLQHQIEAAYSDNLPDAFPPKGAWKSSP
jgi:hypothetical protein